MINDGLTVSLVGMGAVFVVLIVLALSIKAITLLDHEKATLPESNVLSDPVDSGPDTEISDSVSGQQVAAMAVAVALADSGSMPTQPLIPVHRTSSADLWLQSGRARTMSSSRSLARDRRI